MTCIVCGIWTNPTDLCHTCQQFFYWRYEDDGKIMDSILNWFRENFGGDRDE